MNTDLSPTPVDPDDYLVGEMMCIHYIIFSEFCQACEDRSKHIVALEHERLFGYDYA